MKRIFALAALFVLSAGVSSAGTVKQAWAPGWTNLHEPLNYSKSNVEWSVAGSNLTVTYNLVGATPTKMYQVALQFFCTTFPSTFGQFPVTENSNGNCISGTAQGVTKTVAAAEVAGVLTDEHGNGSARIVVGAVAPGTYELEFIVRDGVGCGGVIGGNTCNVDFQSPGPIFGDTTTVSVSPSPTLTSIVIQPPSIALTVGTTFQLTAWGNYSDGSRKNITDEASWSSSDTNVATVTQNGLVTGDAQGTATITAAYEGLSGTGTVIVEPN
jgi:hypothetical protein